MILFALGALAAAVALSPAAAADSPPPASGDWWVTDNTTLADAAVTVNGTLYIVNGSTLSLTNVSLFLNATAPTAHILQIGAGSRLRLEASAIDRVNNASGITANISGGIEARNSTIGSLSPASGDSLSGFTLNGGWARFDHCVFPFGSWGGRFTILQGASVEVANSTVNASGIDAVLWGTPVDAPSAFWVHDTSFGSRAGLSVGTQGGASQAHRVVFENLSHVGTTGATFLGIRVAGWTNLTVRGVDAVGPWTGVGLSLDIQSILTATITASRFVGFAEALTVHRPLTDTLQGSLRMDGLDLNGTTYGLRIDSGTDPTYAFGVNIAYCRIASANYALAIAGWRATVDNSTLAVPPSARALWVVVANVSMHQVEHNTTAVLHDARGYPDELVEAYWDSPLEIAWREGGAPAAGWNASLVLRVGGPYLNGTLDSMGHLPDAPSRFLQYRFVENSTYDLDARFINGTLSHSGRPSITFSQPLTGNLSVVRLQVHDPNPPELILVDPPPPPAVNETPFDVRVRYLDPETGTVSGSASVAGGGSANWAGSPSPILEVVMAINLTAEGSYVLVLRALDLAGNAALVTYPLEFDRVPSGLLRTTPANGSFINQTRFNLTMEGDYDVASILVDGVAATQLPAPVVSFGEGPEFRVALDLSEGPHIFNLTISDHAGNVAFATLVLTVDTVPPNPDILGIIDGQFYNTSRVPVRIEKDLDDTVRIDGQWVHALAAPTLLTNVSLGPGATFHQITVQDRALNSVTFGYLVTLDIDAPHVRFASGVSVERVYVASTSVGFDLIASLDALYVSDGQHQWDLNAAGGVHVALALEAGEHDLRLFALDRALNWGFLNFTVVVDLTPPSIFYTEPRSGARVRSPTVELQVVLDEAGEVSYEGRTFTPVQGVIRVTITVGDGDNDFGLSLRDIAGNTAQATIRLTGDRAAPLLEVASPLNHSIHPQGPVTVLGTTEPGAVVFVNGHRLTVAADGSFAIRFDLDPLQSLLFVVSTDEAGNSATVVLQLDGSPPADYATLLAGLLALGLLLALSFVALRRVKKHPSDPAKGPQHAELKEADPGPSAPTRSSPHDSPSRRPP